MPAGTLRKITVMIPEDLITQATEATGQGITPTIRKGLESVVAAKALSRIRGLRGKVKFSLDFDALRRDFE
jgi:hypothetical protein